MSFSVNAAPRVVVKPKSVPKTIIKGDKPPEFKRLNDPEAQDDLADEFGPYLENVSEYAGLDTYLQTYLRAGFTTAPFFFSHWPTNTIGEGKQDPGGIFFEEWTNTYQELIEKSLLNNVQIKDKTATLFFPRIHVPINFDYGTQVPADNIKGIENTFKKVFPNFVMPTVIEASADKSEGVANFVVSKPYTTDFQPILDFLKIKWDEQPVAKAYLPEKADYGEIAKEIKNSMLVRITLDTIHTPESVLGNDERLVISRVTSARAYTKLNIDAKIVLPLEMLLWMTHSKNMEEFIPPLAVKHFQDIVRLAKAEGNQRVMSLETINENNAKVQKEYAYTPKRRVNADGFTITPSCKIVYIPDNVKPHIYNSLLRNSYNKETGDITPPKEIKELHSIPVNVDWQNDVFSYTSQEGTLIHSRIRGSLPLDNITIGKYLRHDISAPFGSNNTDSDEYMLEGEDDLKIFLSLGQAACNQLNLYDRHKDSGSFTLTSFYGLWQYISETYKDKTIAQIFEVIPKSNTPTPTGTDLAIIDDHDDRKHINVFSEYCRAISDNILNIHGAAVSTLCSAKFLFHLFGYYATKATPYINAFHDARKKNSTIENENAPPPDSIKLPSLPGLKSLLWHQAQIAVHTSTAPDLITLDVQPGGGKCRTGDTLVLTDQGIISLLDLRCSSTGKDVDGFKTLNNFKVLTSDGLIEANKTYKRKGRTILVTYTDGSVDEGLPEHKIWNGTNFVQFSDMKIGTSVEKTINTNLYGSKKSFTFQNKEYKLTPQLARILGYIASEGYNSEKYEIVTITAHNKQVQNDIVDCLNTISKDFSWPSNDFYIYTWPKKKFTIGLTPEHAKFVRSLIKPATSQRITVPKIILKATKVLQKEFLTALWEGDGYCFGGKANDCNRWHLAYTTISKTLASQIKIMMENFGFCINISIMDRKSYYSSNGNAKIDFEITKRVPYELSIHNLQFEKFREEISFVSNQKNKNLSKAIKAHLKSRKGQDTNNKIFGEINYAPHEKKAKLVAACNYFNSLLAKYPYVAQQGNAYRTINMTLGTLAYKTGNSFINCLYKIALGEDFLPSKYYFDIFAEAVESIKQLSTDIMPKNTAQKLSSDKKLLGYINEFKNITSKYWTKVAKIEKGVEKFVYDLSVPGPHNYVAHGKLNHNTISTIVTIMQYLEKNPGKRVGMIVPDILVKEWYSAIAKCSQNQLNAICLTANTDSFKKGTIEKMVDDLKMDRRKFLEYCHAAPPNTIYVIGMNLLNLKRDVFDSSKKLPYVQYDSDSIIEVYPNTLLVRQIGLNRLYVDESQRAKNSEAIIARNVRQVRSEVEGGGILSGTLVGNIGSDLVSQFSLNHPLILNTHDQFQNRYGMVDANNKFLGYKTNINSLLRHDAQPYTMWVQKTRADWAYVLPKIKSQYYQPSLTPNQQKWNNQLIAEAIDEIMSDPKIKKMLQSSDDDENAQSKLENAIKPYLARVEIFINAPDARPAPKKGKASLFFADTSGLEPTDLISPKVAWINRIVYHHFNGGEFKTPSGAKLILDGAPVVFKKQTSKVIVFCYFTEVTDHVFRYFKVAGITAVKYQAGDEEALTRFKEDPNVQVLIASENSLREGLNLQCFAGDTAVVVDKKRAIKFEDLYNDKSITHVMAYDLEKKKIEPKKILKRIRTKIVDKDKFVRIDFIDNNTGLASSLKVTHDHQIFLKGGDEISAGKLKPGDQLITFGSNVKTMELIDGNYLSGDELKQAIETKRREKIKAAVTEEWATNSKRKKSQSIRQSKLVKTKSWRQAMQEGNDKYWSNPENLEKASLLAKVRFEDPLKAAARLNGNKVYLSSKKYSDWKKSYYNDPDVKAMLSKHSKEAWTKQRKIDHAEKMKELWAQEEFRAKVSTSLKEFWNKPKNKKAQSLRSKKSWVENYDEMVSILTEAQNRPEVKAANSLRMTKQWKNKEWSKSVIANMQTAANKPKARKIKSINATAMWQNMSPKQYKLICKKISDYHSAPFILAFKNKYMTECWNDEAWRKNTIKALKKNGKNLEFREMMSNIVVESHEKDPSILKRKMEALAKGSIFPNKSETQVINMEIDNLHYTGAGDYWTTLKMDGNYIHKNPDFIFKKPGSKRAQKVVEVIGARVFTGRDRVYDKKLIKAYKNAGIDCLIIDAEDVWKKPKEVEARIQAHVNNHYLTVKRIVYITDNSKLHSEYKYDLTIEGHHNYFVKSKSETRENEVPVLVHNCASRVIRVNTLWTEGNEEQAISRVMRPDVEDKYQRTEINVDILLTTGTMEMAKRARLISKIIENSLVRTFDPAYMQYLQTYNIQQLPRIKMNLKSIQHLNDQRDLSDYYHAQGIMNQWEDKQFDDKRNILKRLAAEKMGIDAKEVTPDLLKQFAMKPVIYDGKLPNSKQIWTPIPNGAVPYDPRRLDLKPLSIAKDGEDEEGNPIELDSDDDFIVKPDDVVWTEYGFGKVISTRAKTVKVQVPNLGVVQISKQAVFYPKNTNAVAKLKQEIKVKGGISFIRGGDPATNDIKAPAKVAVPEIDTSRAPKPQTKPVENDEIKINKDRMDRFVNKDITFEVAAGIFNGHACVYMFDEQDDSFEDIIKHTPEIKWRTLPKFVYFHIKSPRAVQPVIEKLTTNFAIPKQVINQFENLAAQLYRKGFKTLSQHKPLEWGPKDDGAIKYNFSNFYNMLHTPPKDPTHLKIYPVVEDGELYLVAISAVQKPQINKLKRLMSSLQGVGVGPVGEVDGMLMFVGSTLNSALGVLKILRKRFGTTGVDQAIASLQANKRMMISQPKS